MSATRYKPLADENGSVHGSGVVAAIFSLFRSASNPAAEKEAKQQVAPASNDAKKQSAVKEFVSLATLANKISHLVDMLTLGDHTKIVMQELTGVVKQYSKLAQLSNVNEETAEQQVVIKALKRMELVADLNSKAQQLMEDVHQHPVPPGVVTAFNRFNK